MTINPNQAVELYKVQSTLEKSDEFNRAILAGIMGRVVGNGYLIATMLPVMTYFIWDKFKLKTLWSFAMFAVSAIFLIWVQR